MIKDRVLVKLSSKFVNQKKHITYLKLCLTLRLIVVLINSISLIVADTNAFYLTISLYFFFF